MKNLFRKKPKTEKKKKKKNTMNTKNELIYIPNRLKNQTKTEPKNRLTEPNCLVLILVFVLHKSWF